MPEERDPKNLDLGRSTARDLRSIGVRLAGIQERVGRLAGLQESVEQQFAGIQERVGQLASLQERVGRLAGLQESVEELDQFGDRLQESVEGLDRLQNRAERMDRLGERIDRAQAEIHELANMTPDLDAFRRFGSNIMELFSICVELSSILVGFPSQKRVITSAPGARAMIFLHFVFSKKAVETIFAQIVADMREEYVEALSAHRTRNAKWIVLRGHMSLCVTSVFYVVTSVGKKLRTIWTVIS